MSQGKREEVGSARVELFLDEGGGGEEAIAMVAFPESDYEEVGDLVADRIESSGVIGRVEKPDEGERTDLGTVWWDENGVPTRLEGEDIRVRFDETGSASFE